MKIRPLLLLILTILVCWGNAFSQTTAFTYQGKITDTSFPANTTYDLEFALYTTGGTIVGSAIQRNGVQLNSGVFTVSLDFGAAAFPGADRLLEIRVKRPGEPSYTALTPRQPISSVPYAVHAKSASSVNGVVSGSGEGLANVVRLHTFAGGPIGNISASGSWQFLGGPAGSVTINDTQQLIAVTGSAVLSQTTSTVVPIMLNICRRTGGGSIFPINAAGESVVELFNRRITHTVNIAQVSLLPGTYEIGICGFYSGFDTLNNNGSATGYVIRHR